MQQGAHKVCPRCGLVRPLDDRQCPGCGHAFSTQFNSAGQAGPTQAFTPLLPSNPPAASPLPPKRLAPLEKVGLAVGASVIGLISVMFAASFIATNTRAADSAPKGESLKYSITGADVYMKHTPHLTEVQRLIGPPEEKSDLEDGRFLLCWGLSDGELFAILDSDHVTDWATISYEKMNRWYAGESYGPTNPFQTGGDPEKEKKALGAFKL